MVICFEIKTAHVCLEGKVIMVILEETLLAVFITNIMYHIKHKTIMVAKQNHNMVSTMVIP